MPFAFGTFNINRIAVSIVMNLHNIYVYILLYKRVYKCWQVSFVARVEWVVKFTNSSRKIEEVSHIIKSTIQEYSLTSDHIIAVNMKPVWWLTSNPDTRQLYFMWSAFSIASHPDDFPLNFCCICYASNQDIPSILHPLPYYYIV